MLPTVQQAVLLAAAVVERCERLDLGAQRPGGTMVRAVQRTVTRTWHRTLTARAIDISTRLREGDGTATSVPEW